ncbi:myb-like protein D [Drosophila sechellia]|uniref:myb-like protein D n=1 Tax=Drosophila sechellia TaxID=7238 RepID=UPI0013DE21F9|nr:myb-like protein D [Drosophila sechellia]
MSNPTEGQEDKTSVLEAIKVIDLVEIIPKFEGEGGNKIVGAADRVLDLDEAELNWDQIKGILISHFKDKRSEQDLIMELTNIRERKLEVEALYTKVMTLKRALVSLVKSSGNNVLLRGEKVRWYEEMALNAFVSALKGPIGVTNRNMEGLNIAKAYEIACRERNLLALAESDRKAQDSTESKDKATEEVQKQEEKEESQPSGTHRETGGWPQYRNSRWNQGQANRDRPWNNYGYNNNNGRDGGQLAIEAPTNTEGSGQSRMSKNVNNSNNSGQSRQSYNSYRSNNSNNSNNSGRSFNVNNTSDRMSNQASIRGQLHNIQEDDANFPQSASNNPQDI